MRLNNVRIDKPYYKQGWIAEIHLCDKPYDLYKYLERDLDIDIKVHREKRSLNANNYFHQLVGDIAKVLGLSMTEVKNQMIAEYGCFDRDIGEIILKDSIDWKKIESIHLHPTTATRVLDNGVRYRVYYVMRGSHTYDTKEMSCLINGVVEEAKELGIETLPPDEIERMKQLWHV